jgi:prenyltransferase beta subunit
VLPLEPEADMRFLYCACAISAILGDWSGINVDLAVDYVKKCQVCVWIPRFDRGPFRRLLSRLHLTGFSYLLCSLQSYEGAFGLNPGLESHGTQVCFWYCFDCGE